MNLGDYVRTKNGHIGKILGFCECTECKNRGFYEPILDTREFYITNLDKECNFEGLKFSPNIIDLIEEGDYVNGYEVTSKDQFLGFGNHDWYMTNDEIKSIVTHEQFSAMEYKVESEVK